MKRIKLKRRSNRPRLTRRKDKDGVPQEAQDAMKNGFDGCRFLGFIPYLFGTQGKVYATPDRDWYGLLFPDKVRQLVKASTLVGHITQEETKVQYEETDRKKKVAKVQLRSRGKHQRRRIKLR
jgi:hypothetical protein